MAYIKLFNYHGHPDLYYEKGILLKAPDRAFKVFFQNVTLYTCKNPIYFCGTGILWSAMISQSIGRCPFRPCRVPGNFQQSLGWGQRTTRKRLFQLCIGNNSVSLLFSPSTQSVVWLFFRCRMLRHPRCITTHIHIFLKIMFIWFLCVLLLVLATTIIHILILWLDFMRCFALVWQRREPAGCLATQPHVLHGLTKGGKNFKPKCKFYTTN